jgi:RNA polymerase-binding transcription factor DksA
MAPTTKSAAKATKAPAKATKAKAATKVPAKKAAAKKAAAKKAAPAKKAPAKKAAAAAKKTPAKRSASAVGTKAAKASAAKTTNTRRLVTAPALARNASVKKAPPRRTGPLDKFLQEQLAALEEERVTYTRQAASLKAEADLLAAEREPGDVQFDEESGEGDTLAVERERDLALSAQASAAVEEIDLAIAKINDGYYGVCEQCNSTIPKERLRALPHAALCVQCKSAGFSRR